MPKLGSQLEIPQCPHCGVNTPNLFVVHQLESTSADKRKRAWRIYECKRCGGLITAAATANNLEVLEMYPSQLELDESIRDPARTYLSQALGSIHAPAGAIMLAASAVDAILKSQGYKDGSLYERIDLAAKNHLITDGMARWAHEVRLDANDQRHADENASLPTEADARHSVEFVMALAQFLIVLPARVKRGLATASGAAA